MKKLLLGMTMLMFSVVGFSQSWTYGISYHQDAGNPGGLNSLSSSSTTGWTSIIDGPQSANVWSPVTAIPFAFDFYGSPVTQFIASQNGVVTFDVAGVLPTGVNDNLPSANLPNTTICGFWDEFTSSSPTGSNDDVVVQTFGTAPNRQFWIKWHSFEIGNPSMSYSYFAIVLEETTNNVYIVDQYGAGNFTATVGVQENATNANQFGTNTLNNAGNSSSTSEIDYYLFAPLFLVPDNAGVISLESPLLPLSAGLQNVDVTVSNFGTNDLSSFSVEWEINGTLQTPFVYTGPVLPTLTNSTSLNIGTYNFVNGFTDMKFWTTLPNGQTDNNPANDTLSISVCTPLNGTYAIGGATPDFTAVNEATDALASCGINGPVVFNIAPGVYNETVSLSTISGSSAVNTVTFNGGSAATTTIVDNGSAVIALNGTDYTIWKNLTVAQTASLDGFGFYLGDEADYTIIDSCVILLDPTATDDVIGIVCSGSITNDFSEENATNHSVFSNNLITGGEMGIHIEGPSSTGDWMADIQILNNEFHSIDDCGIYIDNLDTVVIRGNKLYDFRNSGSDGIYINDIANFDISYNEVYAPDYGIYIADANFDFTVTTVSTIVNNMVFSSSDYALYLDDVDQTNVYHNTLYGNPGLYINDFTLVDIRNNIFRSDNDYAFEAADDVVGTLLDYNLYWTSNTNGLFVKDGANIHNNLAAWQTANAAVNLSSIEAEAFFVAANDLRNVGASPNDVGDNSVGVLDDIDGDARPMSPSVTVDIGADEYTPVADDALSFELVIGEVSSCGDSATAVYLLFQNFGTNTINNLTATADVTGLTTTTLNGTYSGTLLFGEIDTVFLGTINTYSGGPLAVTAWVTLSGDAIASNDTISGSRTYIPAEPVGIDATVCGVDTALINGELGYPVIYEWYDAATGGNLVGSGSSFMVPSISTQSTYYLGYGSGIADSLTTTFAGGNGCGGGNMFDVESVSGSAIFGMQLHTGEAVGTAMPVNVYYITGGFSGNETNSGPWSSAGSYTVTSGGTGNPTSMLTLNTPIALPAGTTVGIYVEYNADYTNSVNTYTVGDITVTTGPGLCGSFSSVTNAREFNGTLFFGANACSAVRTPVTAQSVTAPVVDLGADSTVCAVNYTLDAGTVGPQTTWDWSDGTNLQTNTITTSGTYSVEVSNAGACTVSDTVVLVVSGLGVDPFAATATYCAGDSVLLSPVVSANYPYTFDWSSSQTTQDIYVNSAGVYEFTVTDSIGCVVTESTTVSELDNPVAAFTDALSGEILTVTSTATSADSTVYDFGDGTIVSDVNVDHTYSANGTYTVCQYVYNDCGADTLCTTVTVTGIGVDEIAANSVTLHPNPADAVINITVKNATAEVVRVITSEGRLVGTYDLVGSALTIDVSDFPSGIYFVNIEAANGIVVKKFVKE